MIHSIGNSATLLTQMAGHDIGEESSTESEVQSQQAADANAEDPIAQEIEQWQKDAQER